jgi:hypothetical protein
MEDLMLIVDDLERNARLPAGDDERFFGYVVSGLTFPSGHVLGLRRFPVTSVGPGYTSVWLRDPAENWSIFTTVPAEKSCPRYFGSGLRHTSVHAIAVDWTGPRGFTVSIPDIDFSWEATVSDTPVTRLMSGMTAKTPDRLWQSGPFLAAMGVMSGPALRLGRMRLAGTAPNRQRFRAAPRRLWFIDNSSARLGATDFGPPGPLPEQARLGGFWVPQRGTFMIGAAAFETLDPARHLQQSTA